MNTEVFLCGRYLDSARWEVLGIYSDMEKAIERCTGKLDFVVPFTLDHDEPEETLPMENIIYPNN